MKATTDQAPALPPSFGTSCSFIATTKSLPRRSAQELKLSRTIQAQVLLLAVMRIFTSPLPH